MKIEEALKQAQGRLDDAQASFDRHDKYFNGQTDLSFLAPEVAEATRGRLRPLTIPWGRVIISSTEERLQLVGFRLGEQIEPGLWDIWQANDMDEQSQMLHVDSLVHGRSYAMVWADDVGNVRITAESPRQVYVAHAPGSRFRLFAVKRWIDPEGYGNAVLFLPDAVHRYKTGSKVVIGQDFDNARLSAESNWVHAGRIDNPLGVVPVVPFVNRPRTLAHDGESELTSAIPLLDSINKLSTDLMVAAEYHAMPRRYATGLGELPEKTDDQGRPTGEVDTEAFDPLAGRTWLSESEQTNFGEFPGADLAGFTNALERLVMTLGATEGLPSHYLGVTTVNPASADAIRSSEAALSTKARRKQQQLSGSWEEVMRIAVAVRDGRYDPRMDRLETVWKDAETRTVAMAADAAMKLVAAGIIPVEQALEDLGYSPTQVNRMRDMRREFAVDQAATRMLTGADQ